jgi:hypothetical protein
MTIGASSATRDLIENGQTEVKARSALRVPGTSIGGALAAALASITNKERKVRSLTVDGDDNLLSAVEGRVGAELGVVHGDDVVGVDVVEGQGCLLVAHDGAHVLVFEGCAAGADFFDVVVVGTETSTAEDGLLTESTSEETGGSDELSLHFDCCFERSKTEKVKDVLWFVKKDLEMIPSRNETAKD